MGWICWNHESGFSVIDAKDEDDAKLRCELNEPAVLLGEEKEIKENMRALLDIEPCRCTEKKSAQKDGGPSGFGIISNIRERANKILKR